MSRAGVLLCLVIGATGCALPFGQQGQSNAQPTAQASATPLQDPVPTDSELKDDSKPEGDGKPVTSYDAKYNANTIDIDSGTASRIVKSVSSDFTTYTLDGSAPQLQNLTAGKVLLLEGQDLIKVTSVDKSGSDLVVKATQAALTDAITDGHISWNYDVNFSSQASSTQVAPAAGGPSPSPTALRPNPAAVLAAAHQRVNPDAVALGNTLVDFGPTMHRVDFYGPFLNTVDSPPARHFHGKVKDFDVDATISPESLGGLIFDMTATDSEGESPLSRIKVHGRVGHMATSSDIRIIGSQLTGLQINNNDISGEITMEWTAALRNAQHEYTKAKGFPLPLSWTTPFIVGPLVGTFTSSAGLTLTPQIRGIGTSAGTIQVTYNASQNISRTGPGAPQHSGRLGRAQFAITGRTITAGLIPTGLGVDLEFPRFELSLYRSITIFVVAKFHGFGYYSPGGFFGGRACQEAGADFSIIGGGKLSIFGLHEHDLPEKELVPKQKLDKFLGDQHCS